MTEGNTVPVSNTASDGSTKAKAVLRDICRATIGVKHPRNRAERRRVLHAMRKRAKGA